MDMEKLIAFLDSKRGLRVRLAKHLSITPSSITQWKQVPAERAKEISEFTGIPCEELRPDVYGEVA